MGLLRIALKLSGTPTINGRIAGHFAAMPLRLELALGVDFD